jgi:hypothetical protein
MSTTTQSKIDQVLERAVAGGAVPSVAAIAADRGGIIYEGRRARASPARRIRFRSTATTG